MDLVKVMYSNIVLCGGTTQMKGALHRRAAQSRACSPGRVPIVPLFRRRLYLGLISHPAGLSRRMLPATQGLPIGCARSSAKSPQIPFPSTWKTPTIATCLCGEVRVEMASASRLRGRFADSPPAGRSRTAAWMLVGQVEAYLPLHPASITTGSLGMSTKSMVRK